MASAKQIAWRKKFARMSKAGKFKKKQARSKSAGNPKSIGAKSKKQTELERKILKLENWLEHAETQPIPIQKKVDQLIRLKKQLKKSYPSTTFIFKKQNWDY